ncbi:hypothetical protein BH11MYX1_BH11MYX1_21500 [soil metagenome]
MDPLAVISSQTASLTVAVFDASTATEWVHTKPAATKAQFTGHPAEVMRGLGKGEEVATIDVGASNGFAFELEGTSGKIAIYRIDERTIALVAPPRMAWSDPRADDLFAEALHPDAIDAADELGELELASNRLAAVYIWNHKVGAAQSIAPDGGATTFGDGYGEASGVVVDVGAGTHRMMKREVVASWDASRSLTVMYFART